MVEFTGVIRCDRIIHRSETMACIRAHAVAYFGAVLCLLTSCIEKSLFIGDQ